MAVSARARRTPDGSFSPWTPPPRSDALSPCHPLATPPAEVQVRLNWPDASPAFCRSSGVSHVSSAPAPAGRSTRPAGAADHRSDQTEYPTPAALCSESCYAAHDAAYSACRYQARRCRPPSR